MGDSGAKAGEEVFESAFVSQKGGKIFGEFVQVGGLLVAEEFLGGVEGGGGDGFGERNQLVIVVILMSGSGYGGQVRGVAEEAVFSAAVQAFGDGADAPAEALLKGGRRGRRS